MKRVVVLLLALSMIFALAACGGSKTTTCDLCGETKSCKSLTVEGETGWFCDNCYSLAKMAVSAYQSGLVG